MAKNDESRASVNKVLGASASLSALLDSPQLTADGKGSVDNIVKHLQTLQEGIIELANVYDADDASPLVALTKQLQLAGAALIPHIRGGPSAALSGEVANVKKLLRDTERQLSRAEDALLAFNEKQKAVRQKGAEARLAHGITQRCQRIFDLIERSPLPEAEFTDELKALVSDARQAQEQLRSQLAKEQIADVLKVLLTQGIAFRNKPADIDTKKTFIDTLTKCLHALIAGLQH